MLQQHSQNAKDLQLTLGQRRFELVTAYSQLFSYGGSAVKNPPANAGDTGSIPGWGRSPGGNVNLFQYSCLANVIDREARRVTVRGVVKESDYT